MTDTATATKVADQQQDTSGKPDGRPDPKPDQDAQQKTGRQSDSDDGKQPDDLEKLRNALNNERELRKDAEKRAREGASHKAKLDEIEAASQSETEKAINQARSTTRAEVLAEVNTRLVSAEARALAGEMGFRSSHSAAKLLDLSEVKVTDAGVVDAAAIRKLLDSLAADEPYLLADDKPRTPKPDPSQGGSGGKATPSGAERGLAEAERRFGKRTT